MNEDLKLSLAARHAEASVRAVELNNAEIEELALLRQEVTQLREQLAQSGQEERAPSRFGAQLFQLSSGGIQYAVELTVKQ